MKMKQFFSWVVSLFAFLFKKPVAVGATTPIEEPQQEILAPPVETPEPLMPPPPPIPPDPMLVLWEKCLAFYRKQGFFVFDRDDEINILFVSGVGLDGLPNDNKAGKWNDVCLIVRMVSGEWKVAYRGIATTAPGVVATKSKGAQKRGGVLHIVPGQYFAWSAGYHKPSVYGTSHPAMRQVAPITVTRDANMDFSRHGDRQYTGVYGANLHSTKPGITPEEVGLWSEGCATNRDFEHFQKHFMSEVYNTAAYRDSKEKAIFAATFIEYPSLTWHQ